MARLKILFVDHEALLGGAELSMVSLISALKKKDVDIAVAIAGEGELSDALRKLGISEIYYMPMEGWRFWEAGFIQRLKCFLSMPLLLRNIISWCRLFKRVQPDIVHFNLTRLVDPVIAAKWSNRRSIMHFRELTVQNRFFLGGVSVFYRLMHMADLWVANSNATADDIKRYAGSKTLHIVNNGIEISKFTHSVGNLAHSPMIVAKIAGLVEWKNHRSFLDVAADVCSRRSDVVFWLVGRGSEHYTAELKGYAAKCGIADRVVFKGFIEDMNMLLQQVDIVVHTSIKESFGRIYVEAMAASRPVVAFRGPTTSDIILDGETGYVIPDSDIGEMTTKINALLDDKHMREQFGSAGRERAQRLFSLESCADAMDKVYNQIMHPQIQEHE